MVTKALSNTKSHRMAPKPLPAPPTPSHFTYALKSWTVERRVNGWYAAESVSSHYGQAAKWIGPYRNLGSATLAIASQLRAEARERHKRRVEHYRLRPGDPLHGLSRV